jgi:predicted ATPase
MRRSEIRDGVIKNLLEKVTRRNYANYLLKIKLIKLRGFQDIPVSFDFPVTALVGPNGGGKTTILGAAAIAYDSMPPRRFFSKSGSFDKGMLNWKIEYDIIERSINRNDSFKRTASFTSKKWSRDAVSRDVALFGVSRTVPANERKELQKCATNTFSISPSRIESLRDSVITAVGRILGKDISAYSHLRVDSSGRVSLLTGTTADGTIYSEFHFGAGESSVIRMVMQIESLGDGALILIEEIENGLHPLATTRMVEYLVNVAERKNTQAIFTTHSNDALAPLPPQAIWAAVNGNVYQGKLDIAALRAIAGQIDAELAIFCEDTFAEAWLRTILRSRSDIAIEGIEIHAMLGDGTAVKMNKNHNIDPAARFKSVCIVDGDSQQSTSSAEKVYRLPGDAPEAYIFDKVLEKAESKGAILAVRLLQTFESAETVLAILREIRRTNVDTHVIFSQIGLKLGLVPESTVRDAFLATWVEAYPEECATILNAIDALLPRLHHEE